MTPAFTKMQTLLTLNPQKEESYHQKEQRRTKNKASLLPSRISQTSSLTNIHFVQFGPISYQYLVLQVLTRKTIIPDFNPRN